MAANSRLAVATHIMVAIAYTQEEESSDNLSRGGYVEASYIAESVNTHVVLVRRLIGELTHAGLLITHPGRGGGVELARPSHKITLLDIFQALGDMEIFSFNSNPPNPQCPISRKMSGVLAPIFDNNRKALHNSLKKIPLSSLVKQISK